MPVIVLAGEEEFLISRRVKALKKELVDPAWESFNFARIDNPDLKQVIDASATVPFGPGNRLVLLDQCALFTKKRGGKDESDSGSASKSKKLVDAFEAAVGSVAPNTYMVFACTANFDKTLKVSQAVQKHGKIEEFKKFKIYDSGQIITFCQKEAKRLDAFIDEDAAMYLAESTEVDLRQMSQEIEKAATYIMPEKAIRLSHVTLLSPHFSDVFTLLEHWANGEKLKVLASIQELHARNVSPHMVLGAAQFALTKWVSYKTEHEKLLAVPSGGRAVGRRDIPLKDVAMKINPSAAFMIEKDLRKIKGLTLEYLVAKKQELTNLEHMVKTGQMPDSHVLEAFFTR